MPRDVPACLVGATAENAKRLEHTLHAVLVGVELFYELVKQGVVFGKERASNRLLRQDRVFEKRLQAFVCVCVVCCVLCVVCVCE